MKRMLLVLLLGVALFFGGRAIYHAQASDETRIGWLLTQVQRAWRDGVVDFDDRAQSRLFEAVDAGFTQRLAELLEATRLWMQRVNRAFSMGPAGYIWLGIVAFALVLAVLSAIKVTRRIRQLRRTMRLKRLRDVESRRLLRQLGFYLDMLTVLARGGCGKVIAV